MRNRKWFLAGALVVGVLAVAFLNRPVAAQGPPNGLNVHVLNTPLPVTDVDNPEKVPFQVSQRFDDTPAGIGFRNFSLDLPTDKITVVDHVSMRAFVPLGQQVRGTISCQAGGPPFPTPFLPAQHSVIFTLQGTFDGKSFFAASQAIRCFARGNGGLLLSVIRSATTDVTGPIEIAVSAHQIPQ